MRRKNNYKYLLILLLLVSVGYAAIATTLKINGSSQVKSARWNVYWDNESIQVTERSVATTSGNEARVTDAEKTQVEYSVELNEPGDFYEFTVDAVNEGSLNAKIAPNGVKNNVYASDGTTPKNLPDYIGYTVKYVDDDSDVTEGDILEAKTGTTPTRKKYKVKVWYKTDIDPSALNDSTNETMKLMFEVDYVQGDKSNSQTINQDNTETGPIKVLSGTRGNLQPGDKIKIGDTENFYVLSSDNSENGKTLLLAKYNLLVGRIGKLVDGWDYQLIEEMNSTNTIGYGLQSDRANAKYNENDIMVGSAPFLRSNFYWNEVDFNGTYSGNPYPYVYNSNSEIYQYIGGNDGYIKKLKDMGAPNGIEGRLLSYEEAESMQTIEDNGVSIIIDGQQSYWLGSASSDKTIKLVLANGRIGQQISNRANIAGVRPVIEIPTSDI